MFKSFPGNDIKTYFARFWNVFIAKIKPLLKPVSNLWLLRSRLAFVDIDLKKKNTDQPESMLADCMFLYIFMYLKMIFESNVIVNVSTLRKGK